MDSNQNFGQNNIQHKTNENRWKKMNKIINENVQKVNGGGSMKTKIIHDNMGAKKCFSMIISFVFFFILLVPLVVNAIDKRKVRVTIIECEQMIINDNGKCFMRKIMWDKRLKEKTEKNKGEREVETEGKDDTNA